MARSSVVHYGLTSTDLARLPMSMRRIWLGESPPAGTRLEVTFHVQQVTDTTAAYDIRVRTTSGKMLMKIDDSVCGLVREPGVTPLSLIDSP